MYRVSDNIWISLSHTLHPICACLALDLLVVVIGSTVLPVPLKAVRQSLDPAGGAQLQAIVEALPFWPSRQELHAASESYVAGLNQHAGMRLQLPLAASSGGQASAAAPPAAKLEELAPAPTSTSVQLPPDAFSKTQVCALSQGQSRARLDLVTEAGFRAELHSRLYTETGLRTERRSLTRRLTAVGIQRRRQTTATRLQGSSSHGRW